MKAKFILFPILIALAISSARADLGFGSSDSGYDTLELPDSIVELVEGEDFDTAIGELEEYIAEESGNADAWNLLGYSQRKTGQLEASQNSYKKALRLDKRHLGALEYQGELFLTLNKLRKAKRNLKKLEKYCGDCEQYQDLAEAIEAYENG